jgi:Rieske Fe-S protein
MSTEHRTTTEHGTTPAGTDEPSDTAAPGCGCWSRRQSLAVAGVAAAGTAGLTACGDGGAVEGAASSVASAASSAAASAAASAGAAIDAAQIPVGGGKVIEALKVVVTQPTAGDYKAFSAVCTHQACSVTTVEGGVITCPCHGSQFDAATGAVKKGPATKPLEAKSVSVGSDGITVT